MKEETNSGWVKLHRSILRWEWWDDANTARVFIYCLLKANPVQKKWHGITIERGTFITSYPTIAKETGLTLQQIRTAIKRLKSTREITYQTTHDFSIVTITNYERYQQQPNPEEHPEQHPEQHLSNTPATGQQQASNNNEEYKEVKEIKNNLFYDDDARAREENFSEKKIEEIYQELKQQYSEESATTNALRLKVYREYNKNLTTQQIGTYFDEFYETQLAAGLNTANRKDYMIHFANWLYRRIEIEIESNKNKKNRNNGTKRPETLAGADEFVERV